MTGSSIFGLLMVEVKRILKEKGLKYRHLAEKLEMSESSIKRLMTSADGPISKVEAICDALEISFFELVESVNQGQVLEYELTPDQEAFFSRHPNYFYLFHLLYEERMTLAEIRQKFPIKESGLAQYLRQLEGLKLIEWHPNDKIKFLIKGALAISQESMIGKHVMKATMNNLMNYVLYSEDYREKKGGPVGDFFRIAEYFLREETASRLLQQLRTISGQMDQHADREQKMFDIENLNFYTCVVGLIPRRFYYEDLG